MTRDQVAMTLPQGANDPFGRRVLGLLVAPGPHLRSDEGVTRNLREEAARGRIGEIERPEAETREAVARVFRALRYGSGPKRYRLERYGARSRDGVKHELFHLSGRAPGLLRRVTPGMEVSDDLG